MVDHLMFGDVKLFADKDFFDDHEFGKLRIKDESYNLRVIGFAVIDYDDEIYNLREYRGDRLMAIEVLRERSIHWRDDYNDGRVLMLSTCNKNARLYRDVLLAEILQ